jgi:hypothetical protein
MPCRASLSLCNPVSFSTCVTVWVGRIAHDAGCHAGMRFNERRRDTLNFASLVDLAPRRRL